ncbi:unknown [Sutterella sp. CAG:351]|nr:unknown [Sutterella sp. CAG:351]
MHILFVFPEFNRACRIHVSLIADRNELGKANAEVLQNI